MICRLSSSRLTGTKSISQKTEQTRKSKMSYSSLQRVSKSEPRKFKIDFRYDLLGDDLNDQLISCSEMLTDPDSASAPESE